MNTDEEPGGRIASVSVPALAIAAAGLLGMCGMTWASPTWRDPVVHRCRGPLMGRAAGVVITAIVAGLSLNFFHTEPFHSLRISSGRATSRPSCCSIGLGILVSEMSAWRRRRPLLLGPSPSRGRGSSRHRGVDRGAIGSERGVERHPARDHRSARSRRLPYEPGSSPSAPPMQRSGTLVAHTMRLGRDGSRSLRTVRRSQSRTRGTRWVTSCAAGGPSWLTSAPRVAVRLADLYAVASPSRPRYGRAARLAVPHTRRPRCDGSCPSWSAGC